MGENGEEKIVGTNVFDNVLLYIGELGRYQKRLFLLVCAPVMLCAMHKMAWVFLGAYAEHRCLLPWENVHNASYNIQDDIEARAWLSWNEARQTWERCFRRISMDSLNFTNCYDWVFDRNEYSSSAVFEFQLVCDWDWARGTANTALVIGGLIGGMIFGNLSDRLGRRPVFFASVVLQACTSFAASITPSFWGFVLARFALGATIPGVYITSYVLAMEMIGPSKRQYASIILQVFYSLGYLMTALIAYLVYEWRHLQLALSIPGLLCLAYWWLIPESPRWLMSQGRIAEAALVLKNVANINDIKTQQSEDPSRLDKLLTSVAAGMQETDKTSETKDTKPTLFHLLIYFPKLRRRALTVLTIWLVNGVSYFGLSWNTDDLAGNNYINFSISGIVEIPANLFVFFMVSWKGRIPMQSGALLLTAASLLLTVFVPQDMSWLLTTLAMIGKMAITASYGTAYIVSGEIFPTNVRNAGLGACSTMAALGAMVASFIILLSSLWVRLPFILICGLTACAGLLTLTLPETLNEDLPDTLEDGENFTSLKKKLKKEFGSQINMKI